MATLNFKGINKIYPNNVQAVFDFNLDIADKEFIVFVGPSGCGKSTTLRMVAGLEDITSGELYIDSRLVNNVEPKDRDIAMVFQNYALYPHMTVYQNMAFALKLRKVPRPVFVENPEVDAIREENKATLKQIKALYRFAKKNKEPKETFEQIAALYQQIFENEDKIAGMEQQVVGIYEEKIKALQKEHDLLEKEIARFEKEIQKLESVEEVDEEVKAVLVTGLEQKNAQLAKCNEDLEYFTNNEVPLFKSRKLTAYEIDLEIQKAAQILDLSTYLFRKPAALSGGQRQRVALGRAIVRKPKVFLMDEPLSNLDAKLRVQTRSEISKIHKRVGATTIYVTHDQTEAMTMADRIVVMKDGYIQQIGAPENIYADPDNIFVAGFIGNPPMNFLNAHFDGKKVLIKDEEKELELKLNKAQVELLSKHQAGEYDVVVGIRPEEIYLKGAPELKKDAQLIDVVCDFRELLGYELVVYTYVLGQKLLVKVSNQEKIKAGDALILGINAESLYFFDKETTVRIK